MTTTRFLLALIAAGITIATAGPGRADDDVEAIAQVCAGCHGEDGVPLDRATVPIIWGQQRTYLVKQMHDYRAGDRQNETMFPIAEDVKRDEARKIATYFASKAWPELPKATGTPAPRPMGLEHCQACHAPRFEGGASGPRLAGLSYDYLLAAMTSFADGRRTNNGDMPKFMRALDGRELEAMARYISEVRRGENPSNTQRSSMPSTPGPHNSTPVSE